MVELEAVPFVILIIGTFIVGVLVGISDKE